MQARKLPPQRGWQWLIEAFRLWRRNPGLISAAAMASLLLSLFLGALPLVGGPLACLAAPVVSLTVIRICHSVASGQRLRLEQLRIPQPRLLSLSMLGLFLFLALIGGALLGSLIAGNAFETVRAMAQASGEPPATLPSELLWGSIVYLLVAAMAASLMWFAPMLTGLRGVSPFKALFFTVVACWRNKAPFLVLGLGLMALSMPLSLLMALGSVGQSLAVMLLIGVVWPVLNAVNYLSLMDIFGDLFAPGDAE